MADHLLSEIDAALRADRAAQLWNRHKRTIIAVLALVILAVAAKSAWQHYRVAQGGKLFAQLVDAQVLLENGKAEDASKAFGDIARSAHGEVKTIALLWQARAYGAEGNTPQAIAALKEAANGKSLWADMACLRLAGLDAAAAKSCLDNTQETPLSLERAQWAAAGKWAEGDRAVAKAGLEKLIADPMLSQETRTRLMQWLAVMKAQEDKV